MSAIRRRRVSYCASLPSYRPSDHLVSVVSLQSRTVPELGNQWWILRAMCSRGWVRVTGKAEFDLPDTSLILGVCGRTSSLARAGLDTEAKMSSHKNP